MGNCHVTTAFGFTGTVRTHTHQKGSILSPGARHILDLCVGKSFSDVTKSSGDSNWNGRGSVQRKFSGSVSIMKLCHSNIYPSRVLTDEPANISHS